MTFITRQDAIKRSGVEHIDAMEEIPGKVEQLLSRLGYGEKGQISVFWPNYPGAALYLSINSGVTSAFGTPLKNKYEFNPKDRTYTVLCMDVFKGIEGCLIRSDAFLTQSLLRSGASGPKLKGIDGEDLLSRGWVGGSEELISPLGFLSLNRNQSGLEGPLDLAQRELNEKVIVPLLGVTKKQADRLYDSAEKEAMGRTCLILVAGALAVVVFVLTVQMFSSQADEGGDFALEAAGYIDFK